MARFIKDRIASRGQVPGSLILIGKQKMEKPVIRMMEYDEKTLDEKELKTIEEARESLATEKVTWINIYGIHDLEVMKNVAEMFRLPHLIMEDILNTDQRPRYEDGEDFDAFIMKMFKYDVEEKRITAEQITLVVGNNFVLTLQEQLGDVFDPVRERIRQSRGKIRQNDNDYLAYALLDTIVDNYIFLIETLGLEIEKQEELLFNALDKSLVQALYKLKTEVSFLRKSVRPVRDMMQQLLKSDNSMFQMEYHSFLRDLNDLVIQATEAIELYNNMITDQLNIYHTNVSNRGNEVMQVLTIFASVFIPLTFIAGVYGMNFDFIPELKFKYGYLGFWIVSLLVAGGLFIYFRRKKWF